jgi:hypothetical protein
MRGDQANKPNRANKSDRQCRDDANAEQRCQAEFADVNAEAHGAIFTETERGELPGVFQ